MNALAVPTPGEGLLKKRVRPAEGNSSAAAQSEATMSAKRPKLEPAAKGSTLYKTAVYKSLFDESRRRVANDGSDRRYEGDFMTRSAKFGLQ